MVMHIRVDGAVACRILEPILFCQAIEIKDPTSLFFEDADKFL